MGWSERIFELLDLVYTDGSPWSRAQIVSDLLNTATTWLVAEEGGELVAVLATQLVLDECEITNLAVRPGFQRRGIASQLLSRLVSDCSGPIFLEVRRSNLAAQQLYAKFGFVQYHERKDYYTRPVEDALLFKRERNQ